MSATLKLILLDLVAQSPPFNHDETRRNRKTAKREGIAKRSKNDLKVNICLRQCFPLSR